MKTFLKAKSAFFLLSMQTRLFTFKSPSFGGLLIKLMKVSLLLLFSATSLAASTVFEFGLSNSASSVQQSDVQVNNISTALIYDADRGFGFDFDSAKQSRFTQAAVIAEQSLYFSVRLPEGRYQVDLSLGSELADSTTTLKAESRRLMLNQVHVPKGQTLTRTIVLDVRSPVISASQQITLKDRELNELNWDNKLTLEFAAHSAIKRIKITAVKDVPVIFLAGDSTVTDQDVEPWASWGQLFTQYLSPDIVVANYAVSGASLYSFKASLRLDKILSVLKKGDYVFIQFAHNDEKRRGEGIGPWLSYSDLLREYVERVRHKGGIPLLLTPVQRRFFDADGTLQPTHGDYPAAIRKVAADNQVPLIDLTQLTTSLYESWGDERSRQAFVQYPANTFVNQPEALKDNTHFNYFGANEIALCVVKGIWDAKLDLSKYLGANERHYDPQTPNVFENWSVPMSPRFVATKPEGS